MAATSTVTLVASNAYEENAQNFAVARLTGQPSCFPKPRRWMLLSLFVFSFTFVEK